MWKWPNLNPCTPIKRGDLGVFMSTQMKEIGMNTWDLMLQHPNGKSLFTGEYNWVTLHKQTFHRMTLLLTYSSGLLQMYLI